MNKILVTGAAGFIGFNFIRQAVEKGVEVVALDKMTYAANKEAPEFFKENGIVFLEVDINDLKKEDVISNDISTIVNFAAETHVDNSITNPDVFIKTNINGTFNLLSISKELDLRYHQISTDEVYGDLPLDRPDLRFKTNSQIKPSSPYSSSKAAADLLVNAFSRTYGLRATISRCSNNYGPYQNEEKLIPKTIKNLLNGKKIGIYGNGKNIRDWIYVSDHNEAVFKILFETIEGTFNVGAGNEIRNIEIVNEIASNLKIDGEFYEFIEDRKGHDERYAIDPESMESIGWEPQTTFNDGICNTIKFYEEKWK